jgi:hypothetical protein
MSYATLAEFKAYLKIPTATTSEDTLLQTFLDEADEIIDEVVGTPSAAAAATSRTFDDPALIVDGTTLLFGRAAVAAAISTVVNGDGTTVASTSYTTLPPGELPIYGLKLKGSSGITWAMGGDGIVVTALWANTTNANGSVDSLIRGAALQLAAWLYRSKDNVTELSRPVQTADGVTVLPLALPRAVLDRFNAEIGILCRGEEFEGVLNTHGIQ